MAARSFQDLRRELEECGHFLQSFSRGDRGFTRGDGTAGVERLRVLCAQLEELLALGGAPEADQLLTVARCRIAEARARLER